MQSPFIEEPVFGPTHKHAALRLEDIIIQVFQPESRLRWEFIEIVRRHSQSTRPTLPSMQVRVQARRGGNSKRLSVQLISKAMLERNASGAWNGQTHTSTAWGFTLHSCSTDEEMCSGKRKRCNPTFARRLCTYDSARRSSRQNAT